jgi:hypothetical protein
MGLFDLFKTSWKKVYDGFGEKRRGDEKKSLNDMITNYSSASNDLIKKQSELKEAEDKLQGTIKVINENGGEKILRDKIDYLVKLGSEPIKKGGANTKRKSSNKRNTKKKHAKK